MLVLDTNHLVEFDFASDSGRILEGRLRRAVDGGEQVATTIVNVEEQLRGWLAQVLRVSDPGKLVAIYRRLQGRIDFFARWYVLPFDEAAAQRYAVLRSRGIRIGSMDLRIAAIVLARDASLLSSNLRDFERVPELRVEDWLTDRPEPLP